MKPLTSSKRKAALIIAAALFLMGMILPAVAQPPAGDKPDKDGPGMGPDRERIETVIIGKFATELDLTPEQGEKFFPRLKQFHNQVEELQKANHERRDQMRALSDDPKADQGKVKDLIAADVQHDQQIATMKQQFLADVSAFLTPQQVSRCAIMLDEMPRRIHEFMREHGRRGMRGGDDDDDGPGGPRQHEHHNN